MSEVKQAQVANLSAQDRTKALDLIHNQHAVQKLLENPHDPDVRLLDYVYDLELQKTLLTEVHGA